MTRERERENDGRLASWIRTVQGQHSFLPGGIDLLGLVLRYDLHQQVDRTKLALFRRGDLHRVGQKNEKSKEEDETIVNVHCRASALCECRTLSMGNVLFLSAALFMIN